MTLDVIGAGFGRTGTLSLKLALERLGFGRCYHMAEVLANPGHAARWAAALDGDLPDWDALFADYRAAVDWPSCHFWREQLAHFPDAKVILSLRDGESWYDSVHSTIYQVLSNPPPFGHPEGPVQIAMAQRLVREVTFGGKFEDRAHAIAVFDRHNAEVQRSVSPERLLVFRASEGWEPLCQFLGVDVPAEDYPRVNASGEFRDRMSEAKKRAQANKESPA